MDPAKSMFSESKVSVDSNGNVTWRPKFDIRTKCDIDLTSWPWDKHKCTILLSTWSHKISNVFYEIKENQKPVSNQAGQSIVEVRLCWCTITIHYIMTCKILRCTAYDIFHYTHVGMFSSVSFGLETRQDDELVRGRQHPVGRYRGIYQQRWQ